jgi:hypothetical protein
MLENAQQLDDLRTQTGLDGMLLSWVDYRDGLERFGRDSNRRGCGARCVRKRERFFRSGSVDPARRCRGDLRSPLAPRVEFPAERLSRTGERCSVRHRQEFRIHCMGVAQRVKRSSSAFNWNEPVPRID